MVETYQQQVRSRGANQQDLNVRVDADAFGAGVGRAVQGLGQQLGGLAELRAKRDTLMADNDARAAENGYLEDLRLLRFDPEKGYLNQTGENALGRRAGFEDEVAKARDRRAQGLSPQARRIFERSTDSITNGVREQAIKHDSEALRTVTNQTGEASATAYLNEALLTYNDPDLFAQNVGRAVGELDRVAALNGQPEAARAIARQKLISSAYSGAALRMADEGLGGAVRAQEFINENAELFNAEDKANLDKALKPLVQRDSARVWVNDQAGVTPRPSETYGSGTDSMSYSERAAGVTRLLNDPYARETRRRESGNANGRLDAANPVSSARGPYQFIKSTWLSMVRQAQANGGAAWAEGLTEDQIAEYRWTGGAMAGRDEEVRAANDEMFVQFRQYNQNVLTRAGFEATPENEYLLHLMGEGGGINFLRASDGAFVESVMGLDAAQKNNLVGVTVGQYKRRLASAYGAPGAPAGGAEYDYAKLYADAAKVMETDPERGMAIIAELDARRGAQEAARTAGQQQTFDDLYTRGVQTGDWNLSAQDSITLGASMSEAFRTAGQNHMQGIQYTDPVVFSDLEEMAATNPSAFTALELGDFLKDGKLTDGDYRALRSVQTELGKVINPTPEQASAVLAQAMGGIDPVKMWTDTKSDYELITGVNPDSDKLNEAQRVQIARFKQAMTQAVQEATQAKGTELTPVERQTLVANMLEPVEVQVQGPLGGSTKMVPRFDAMNQIAPGTVQAERRVPFEEISNDLRTALGMALPADIPQGERKEQVERMFNDMLTVARGGMPEVTIEDIPADLFAEAPAGASEGFLMDGLNDFAGMFGESDPGSYLIDVGDGVTMRLTEEELLGHWAEVTRERYLNLMQQAGIDPAQMLQERPAYVYE